MKNLCTPVESEDIRSVITTNLDRAAKLNFAQVQQESHLEGLNFMSRQIFSDFDHLESNSLPISREGGSEVLHCVKSEVVLLTAKMRHAHSALVYIQRVHTCMDFQPLESDGLKSLKMTAYCRNYDYHPLNIML